MRITLHDITTDEIKVWHDSGVERGIVQSTGELYEEPWHHSAVEVAARMLPELVGLIARTKSTPMDLLIRVDQEPPL